MITINARHYARSAEHFRSLDARATLLANALCDDRLSTEARANQLAGVYCPSTIGRLIAMINITRPDSEGIEPLLALEKHPNVYIRTSLHNPSNEQMPFRDMWPYLERLYDRYGPQRMLYANFYELLIMKDLIPFFTAEDKEWILGKTALGIYFVKES